MIPNIYIQEWKNHVHWVDTRQIEQDLIITRALCELFNSEILKGKIALRGGTAIHKLLFRQPMRYSEDIDLVQTKTEPIGPTLDAVRNSLAWLGKCKRHQRRHSVRLEFKFTPEFNAEFARKIKVEINTREQQSLYEIVPYPLEIASSWHKTKCQISSFSAEELFGTKLRALLQRRQNRDLFDLYEGYRQLSLSSKKLIACFEHYLKLQNVVITRANAEQRMLEKLRGNLTDDVVPLLPADIHFDDDMALEAFNFIWRELIGRIKGNPWKLSEIVIDELRRNRFPNLLVS